MAAVCCHFNPTGSVQRVRNYERFRRLIDRDGIPLVTVELAFDDSPFDLPPGRQMIQIRGGDVMWQKERLLQVGAERALDEGFRKLVFLDADVVFRDDDWAGRVSRVLDSTPVVQCFSRAIRNYADAVLVQNSAVSNVVDKGLEPGPAKGIAWGILADTFEKAGLYQHCVVGGGDTAFAFAALGFTNGDAGRSEILPLPVFMEPAGKLMNAHYTEWADRLYRAAGGGCGYVEQTVFTLSHGSRQDRNYVDRHMILEGFDPEREVAVDPCGAFVWTGAGRDRAGKVAEYFLNRQEDPG